MITSRSRLRLESGALYMDKTPTLSPTPRVKEINSGRETGIFTNNEVDPGRKNGRASHTPGSRAPACPGVVTFAHCR